MLEKFLTRLWKTQLDLKLRRKRQDYDKQEVHHVSEGSLTKNTPSIKTLLQSCIPTRIYRRYKEILKVKEAQKKAKEAMKVAREQNEKGEIEIREFVTTKINAEDVDLPIETICRRLINRYGSMEALLSLTNNTEAILFGYTPEASELNEILENDGPEDQRFFPTRTVEEVHRRIAYELHYLRRDFWARMKGHCCLQAELNHGHVKGCLGAPTGWLLEQGKKIQAESEFPGCSVEDEIGWKEFAIEIQAFEATRLLREYREKTGETRNFAFNNGWMDTLASKFR